MVDEVQNPDQKQPNLEVNKVLGESSKPKWTKEELLQIFDELIFSGVYKEDVNIRGRLKVTFRSRTTDETLEISKKLDGSQYNLITTVQEERARLNLSKSLVFYQGKDFGSAPDDEKLKFIGKLPVQIVSSLSDELANFDRKVEAACREAEENF